MKDSTPMQIVGTYLLAAVAPIIFVKEGADLVLGAGVIVCTIYPVCRTIGRERLSWSRGHGRSLGESSRKCTRHYTRDHCGQVKEIVQRKWHLEKRRRSIHMKKKRV